MNKTSVSIAIVVIIQAVLVASFQNPAKVQPESENMVIDGIPLGERIRVDAGGYSLRPVVGFSFEADTAGTAFLSWQEGAMLFLMEGGSLGEDGVVEEELSQFLLRYASGLPQFQITGMPYFYTSDSYVFQTVNTMFSNDAFTFEGMILARMPSEGQYFIMFATAPDEVWNQVGIDVMDVIMSEMEFFEASAVPLQ